MRGGNIPSFVLPQLLYKHNIRHIVNTSIPLSLSYLTFFKAGPKKGKQFRKKSAVIVLFLNTVSSAHRERLSTMRLPHFLNCDSQ